MSWITEKLGNLLVPSGFDRAGSADYPVLSITMHEGLIDQSAKFKKRVASKDISNYRVVYANELVVGFPIDEGVLGFQAKYPAAVVSPAYGVWKLKKPEETFIPFLQRYLRSKEARGIYASKMRGAVARRRNITRDDFLDIDIPFPSLDDQRRIAALLDKADALRDHRYESVRLSGNLIQSAFIDMFGDPVENPLGLPTLLLGDVIKVSSGASLLAKNMAPGGMYPVFGGNGISGYHDKYMFEDPKIVIGRVGAHCGSVHISPPKSWVTDNALFVDKVLIDIDRIYLAHALRYAKLNQYAGRAAQPLVSGGRIYPVRILIPLPEQQERFRKAVGGYDRLKDFVGEHRDKCDALFSSVQQRAFRGELDLRRLELEDEVEDVGITPITPPVIARGKYRRPGAFIAPPEIEAQMLALEEILEFGPEDSIPWSEDYFKYRTLSQVLRPPFNCAEIMEKVHNDMPDATYEDVRSKLFQYLEAGDLEQQFDKERKEIVFVPRA